MTLDDATRRQLRFSLFLQGAALLMFAVALIAQVATGGGLGLIAAFGVGVALVSLAIAFTVRRLRSTLR